MLTFKFLHLLIFHTTAFALSSSTQTTQFNKITVVETLALVDLKKTLFLPMIKKDMTLELF
jgi:hypothetical protein